MELTNEKTKISLMVISDGKIVSPSREGQNGFFQLSLPGLAEFKFIVTSSNKQIYFTVKATCGSKQLTTPFDGNTYFKDTIELASKERNGGKNMIIGIDRSNEEYNQSNRWIFNINTFEDELSNNNIYNQRPCFRSLGAGCYTENGTIDTQRVNTIPCKRKIKVGDELKFANQLLCSDSEDVRAKKLRTFNDQKNREKLRELTRRLDLEEKQKDILTQQLLEKSRVISDILRNIEALNLKLGPSPESQFMELT